MPSVSHVLTLVVVSTIVASVELSRTLGVEIFTNNDDTAIEYNKGNGAYCASDCSTMMVCAGNNRKPATTFPCPSPNQYCIRNTCTSVPDPSCPNGSSGFFCTNDGIFPEPSDCRRSRICVNGESKLHECPVGFVFDSHLNVCQRGSTPSTRIDCSRATALNPFIVYASNPAYYAMCVNRGNGRFETFMFKCQRSEIFDTSIKSCRFNCAVKGNFQNPANCTEYFNCNSASPSTRPTTLSCPKDFVFDGNKSNSDPESCEHPPGDSEDDKGNDEDDQVIEAEEPRAF